MDVNQIVAVLTDITAVPLMIILLGGGIFLTVKNGFIQFRYFPYAMKKTIGSIFKKTDAKGTLTPFQAASSALASTLGAANIVGVPAAIAIGGPGSIFWMWVTAFVGMATKYSEIVLGIKYRRVNEKGDYVGGSMYYMTDGAGWKKLALGHAFLCALTIYSSVSVQANSIGGSISSGLGIDPRITGCIVALLIALVTTGGIKSIGKFAEKCVPAMSVAYMLVGLAVIVVNIESVPKAFEEIFVYAFRPISAVGGFVGAGLSTVIRIGVARGLYTNEAGNGSAAIAHSTAKTPHPSEQGMWGIFEVFFDTIVVCTVTALIILTTDVWTTMSAEESAAMPGVAIGSVLGGNAGNILVSIFIFFFAFNTILLITYYGEKRVEFLFGTKASVVARYIYITAILVGTFSSLVFVWSLMDILFACVVIPNMVVVLYLSDDVRNLTREYFSKVKKKISTKE